MRFEGTAIDPQSISIGKQAWIDQRTQLEIFLRGKLEAFDVFPLIDFGSNTTRVVALSL
jgi:hypothetical protein